MPTPSLGTAICLRCEPKKKKKIKRKKDKFSKGALHDGLKGKNKGNIKISLTE